MHTHEIVRAGPALTKRYTSWSRGEHRREWSALCHLHVHARGLAPAPIAANLDAVPPTVTMSDVAGEPLSGFAAPPRRAAIRGVPPTPERVGC